MSKPIDIRAKRKWLTKVFSSGRPLVPIEFAHAVLGRLQEVYSQALNELEAARVILDECDELRERNVELQTIVDKLHDNDGARKIARCFGNPPTDIRYCPTRANRMNGVKAYRKWVLTQGEADEAAEESP